MPDLGHWDRDWGLACSGWGDWGVLSGDRGIPMEGATPHLAQAWP